MANILMALVLTIVVFIAIGFIPKKVKYVRRHRYSGRDKYVQELTQEEIDSGYYVSEEYPDYPKYTKKIYQLLSLFVFVLVIGLSCFTTIKPNTVGVVYDQFGGGLKDETLGEGFNFITPFQHVYKISTKTETREFVLAAQTGTDSNGGGGQFVTYELTINYNISKEDAGKFYRVFATTEVGDVFLSGKLREAMQYASTRYDVFSIMKGKLNDVRAEAERYLATELAKSHITLSGLTIKDVDAGKEIEAIIVKEAQAEKQKEIAQKEAEAAKIKAEAQKEIAIIEAEKKIELAKREAEEKLARAEGEAEAAKIKAEADAEIERIKAEAESYAKKVLANTLAVAYGFATEDENGDLVFRDGGAEEYAKLVAYLAWCEAWDGKLPNIVVGEDGSIGIILPPNMEF